MPLKNPSKRFIWIDVETTGTDPKTTELLEVAAVITDDQLTELGSYESLIWVPDNTELHRRFSPFIMKMHGNAEIPFQILPGPNTLLEQLQGAKKESRDVERDLLTFFFQNGVEPNRGILAGASIHFDRGYLQRFMPLLEAFFYHRMFDVSALKTATELWGPDGIVPVGKKAHRAMDDVRETLTLARTIKVKIFEAMALEVARSNNQELEGINT